MLSARVGVTRVRAQGIMWCHMLCAGMPLKMSATRARAEVRYLLKQCAFTAPPTDRPPALRRLGWPWSTNSMTQAECLEAIAFLDQHVASRSNEDGDDDADVGDDGAAPAGFEGVAGSRSGDDDDADEGDDSDAAQAAVSEAVSGDGDDVDAAACVDAAGGSIPAAKLDPWATAVSQPPSATAAAILAAQKSAGRRLKGSDPKPKSSRSPAQQPPGKTASAGGSAPGQFSSDFVDDASLTSPRASSHSGLVNSGSSCFLDTVLQVLAHNDDFCHWLDDVAPRAKGRGDACVVSALLVHATVTLLRQGQVVDDRGQQLRRSLGMPAHGHQDALEAATLVLESCRATAVLVDRRFKLKASSCLAHSTLLA